MIIFSNVYMNFYGVATIAGFIFYLAVGLFIIFSIKDKSTAAFHLGVAFFFAAMLAFPYIISAIWFHPVAAFHRWMTVIAAALNLLHYGMFNWNFPRARWKRSTKTIMIALYILIGLVSVYFYQASIQSSYIFKFAGHYYDFDADGPSKIVGGVLLLLTFNILIAGIFQFVASRKKERWASLGITLCLLLAMMVPAITNVLSRDGLISRAYYQNSVIYASVTGFFLALILFINNSTDKTTFLARIIGVCLVTVLFMQVMISYNVFEDKEEAFDLIKNESTKRIVDHYLLEKSQLTFTKTADLEYLIVLNDCASAEKQRVPSTYIYQKESTPKDFPPLANFQSELDNTCIYSEIHNILVDPNPDSGAKNIQIKELLQKTPPEFAGYKGLILAYIDSGLPIDQLDDYIDSLERKILYRYNKLRSLDEKSFQKSGLENFSKLDNELIPFREALKKKYSANSQNLNIPLLHNELLKYLKPMKSFQQRRYRSGSLNDHYISYQYYNPDSRQMFEAGYSYRSYREFMHTQGMRMLYILLAFVAIIVLGFRLFFLGTLINPLQTLLQSVRSVNKGDLNVHVPVLVEDEIGFLSRSFNGMVRSIRSAQEKLQEHADQLEVKVQERTAELQETLKTVQQLKTSQDGDYFLTAMIIKPLASNNVHSETVNVEFLLNQKKKFEFRKWKEEIGGDLCSAHSITLKQRPYTVFLNADAMGKSMQGAGGALVLGAVFESIIERTKMSQTLQDQFPERWLKNAFVELQKIFESFDGTMLVSAAMGLVDDGNGLLYYINAEHPWTVLYRDGEASFIETELAYRKLGMPSTGSKINIQTIELQAGDVLIAGSDGRDDILIGNDENGDRIINEDEQLFLPAVEAGKGNLEAIIDVLAQRGEFTDDLSLIRISFLEDTTQTKIDESEIDEALIKVQELATKNELKKAEDLLLEFNYKNPGHARIQKSLVRLYMKLKRFEDAGPLVQQYIAQKPFDTEMIYFASIIARKLGSLLEAIDLGERVRLRNPNMVRNLLHLAGSYHQSNNKDRALKILDEAEAVEPGDDRIQEMRNKMQ